MSNRRLLMLIACAALWRVAWAPHAAGAAAPPPRAKPPQWTPEVLDVFFTDAREHLVGERPADAPPAPIRETPANGNAPPADQPAPKFAWSRLITGDSLATEVKRIAARLRTPLANTTRFKAADFKKSQADFSELAVLFAVIAEYDGDVRWRDQAPALRDALAQAAAACKTPSDESFALAQRRAGDIEEVVRGGRLDAPSAKLASDQWHTLADRAQLMQRMQLAFRDRIRPQLADARQFTKSAVELRHEADMLAVLAEVIRRPQYEYWDDDSFVGYARALGDAAAELSRAIEAQNYEAARAALSRAGQACTDCHEGYRL